MEALCALGTSSVIWIESGLWRKEKWQKIEPVSQSERQSHIDESWCIFICPVRWGEVQNSLTRDSLKQVPLPSLDWRKRCTSCRVRWNQMGFLPLIGRLTMSREGELKSKPRKCIMVRYRGTLHSLWSSVLAGLLWLNCTQMCGIVSQLLRITVWYIREGELNSFSSKIYCFAAGGGGWSFISTVTWRGAEKNCKKGEIIISTVFIIHPWSLTFPDFPLKGKMTQGQEFPCTGHVD